MDRGYRTQWAAQHAVASELLRLNYQAIFTPGNYRDADLTVISPTGTHFLIDVKGQYRKAFWIISTKECSGLFYVLAYVPDREPEPNQFFVLTQEEVNAEIRRHIERVKSERIGRGQSIERTGNVTGLLWSFAEQYRERWDKLPK